MGFSVSVTTKTGKSYQATSRACQDTKKTYKCRFCSFSSIHPPATSQHEKVKHPAVSSDADKRGGGSLWKKGCTYAVHFTECDATDFDNKEWVMVDLTPVLSAGAVGNPAVTTRKPARASATRDSEDSNIGRRGAAKRKSYEAVTKVEVLEVYDRHVSSGSKCPLEDAGTETGVHLSLISKWANPKTRQEIYVRAGDTKQKHLRKKARKFTGLYADMEDELYKEFCDRRARGRRCGPLWLSVRGRSILKEQNKKAKAAQQRSDAAAASGYEKPASEAEAPAAVDSSAAMEIDGACYVCRSATWGPEKHPANTCATCGLSWHHICSQPQCARCSPNADLPPEKIPPVVHHALAVAADVDNSSAVVDQEKPLRVLSDCAIAKFKGGHSWRGRFSRRFKLASRKRTNCKSKSKENRVPGLLKWHSDYFKMLRGDNAPGSPKIHEKWGRFGPNQRVNVDQTPLGFISGLQDTYEHKGTNEVWISTPNGSSLEKRQCTLQVCFVADAEGYSQPRLAIIFRGLGVRISAVEKAAWDPRVDVYFQPKAWADRDFCVEWAKRTFAPWAKGVAGEKVLLMDNLDGQLTKEFRDFLKKDADTLPWYFLPQCTDLLQPVDRHVAQMLKLLVAAEQESWLEDDANLDKWESGLLTASERRILLTWWSGEALEKLWKKHSAQKAFDGTGSNLTIDLSDLHKVKPQNVSNYAEMLLEALKGVHAVSSVGEGSAVSGRDEAVLENVPAARGGGESSGDDMDSGVEDALDSDDETALHDAGLEEPAQPYWIPEGMCAVLEPPTLVKKFVKSIILFKWFQVGWQLGRVRKKLPTNKDNFNFQVFYPCEGRIAKHTLSATTYVGNLTEAQLAEAKDGSWLTFEPVN
ncbi:hypothetical protein CYMTET_35291 [Cymbomonas tetramitiformis]|uniref:DDE-1 domain-containing protein n=1 Tax=Cymbomonas tetramitiformis TaxID=36881 RepID=A0AAE0F9V6_9CHLO|nr:hypothetical protein CYMTET_35291 [Cymbomonas tetramitiformis]